MNRAPAFAALAVLSLSGNAAAQAFASPTGMAGAGLGMQAGQDGRAWGEMGLFLRDDQSIFSPIGGLGLELNPKLELQLVLPMSHAAIDPDQTDFMVGNPFASLSYIGWGSELRFKVGGGATVPLFNDDDAAEFLNSLGAGAMRGFQDFYLFSSKTLSLVAPVRVESGRKVVFSIDAAPILTIPVGNSNDDMDLAVQFAPGAGVYLDASQRSLIGGRLPLVWVPTRDGDNAFLAIEPFFRQQVGSGFFNTRLTLNLDEPLGFAFDDDGYWGLHVGGGGAF